MRNGTRLAPKANTQAAWRYVSEHPGCSALSAATVARLDKSVDLGVRAVLQALDENLIRINSTGSRNRLWPAGIVLSRMVCDLKAGDWFVDPIRPGRRLAKVDRLVRMRNGRAYFVLSDETGRGPWVTSYPLRVRVEMA